MKPAWVAPADAAFLDAKRARDQEARGASGMAAQEPSARVTLIRGASRKTIATDPGMAIICAAGPVRVCHKRSAAATIPGAAAPIVRRRTSSRCSPSRPNQYSASGRGLEGHARGFVLFDAVTAIPIQVTVSYDLTDARVEHADYVVTGAGVWLALVLGASFVAVYASRVSSEARLLADDDFVRVATSSPYTPAVTSTATASSKRRRIPGSFPMC